MSEAIEFRVVDLFSAERMRGTPVAVWRGGEVKPAGEKLALAAELSLPLTVFLDEKKSSLEAFSPRRPEGCPLTAALAAAAFLSQESAAGRRSFSTSVGKLEVGGPDENRAFAVEFSQIRFEPYRYRKELLAGVLGLDRYRLPDHWPLRLVWAGGWCLVVPVVNREALDDLRPDYDSLARLCEKMEVLRAVLYTWQGPAELYLRFLAPSLGVFEEPFSASAAMAAAALLVSERALTLTPPNTRLSAVGGLRLGRPARAELEVTHTGQKVEKIRLRAQAALSFFGRWQAENKPLGS